MTRLEKLVDVALTMRLSDRYREYPLPNLVSVANDLLTECERTNGYPRDAVAGGGWDTVVNVHLAIDPTAILGAIAGATAAARGAN